MRQDMEAGPEVGPADGAVGCVFGGHRAQRLQVFIAPPPHLAVRLRVHGTYKKTINNNKT